MQEFKKQYTNSDPLSQLIAQMACSIEINKGKKMRGAYNIGSLWFFVVLEKIANDKYQYHESESFDSLKINDLKKIFINLKAIKHKYCNF